MAKNPHTESNSGPAEESAQTHEQSKNDQLEEMRSYAKGHDLHTNQGVRIADNHNSLKAGERGPTLLEDFIFREKMNHFDNERIPERIVHARGAAAHGFFPAVQECGQPIQGRTVSGPRKENAGVHSVLNRSGRTRIKRYGESQLAAKCGAGTPCDRCSGRGLANCLSHYPVVLTFFIRHSVAPYF